MNYMWASSLKMLYFTLLSAKSIFPWLCKQIFTSFSLVSYMGKNWHELVLLAFVFCILRFVGISSHRHRPF